MTFHRISVQVVFVFLINFLISAVKPQDSIKRDCQPEQQKYVVSIRRGTVHVCAGALINSDWVVTAAHCKEEGLNVLAGMSGDSKTRVFVYVKRFHPHPRYYGPPWNDIALVSLADPIKESDFISYVKLPNKTGTGVCDNAIAMGWGRLWSGENTLYPKNMQCFPVSTLSFTSCQKALHWFRDNHLSCSLSYNKGKTCLDDYGGPVMCEDIQVGVVAWQVECGQPFIPGIYARVDKYLEFIKSVMNSSSIIKGDCMLAVVSILAYFVKAILE